MENGSAVAIRENNAPAVAPGELSVDQVLAQAEKIQTLMKKAMKPNEHFGVIPGTAKPTLLKAGAEKLCFMFRLDPQYSMQEMRDGHHVEVISTCTLYHIPTGARMGSGMGSCSTKESKYAYRKAERECPSCHKPAIIKGKDEYGGGWLCWKKKEGCGASFKDGDPAIEGQQVGRLDNPDLADQYNTVLKMANKRSLVAAVLNVTAASDIFTQDLEDLREARESLVVPEADAVETTATKPAAAAEDDPRRKRRATAEAAKAQAEKPKPAPAAEPITSEQSFEIEEMLKESNNREATEQGICDQFNVSSIDGLTSQQAEQIIAIFKRKLARRKVA